MGLRRHDFLRRATPMITPPPIRDADFISFAASRYAIDFFFSRFERARYFRAERLPRMLMLR